MSGPQGRTFSARPFDSSVASPTLSRSSPMIRVRPMENSLLQSHAPVATPGTRLLQIVYIISPSTWRWHSWHLSDKPNQTSQ